MGVLAFALGAAILAGWQGRWLSLVELDPWGLRVAPSAGAGMLLCGAALAVSALGRVPWVVRSLGAIASVVAGLALLQTLWDHGSIGANARVGASLPAGPRFAHINLDTALALILLGVALALRRSPAAPGGTSWAKRLAWTAGVLAVVDVVAAALFIDALLEGYNLYRMPLGAALVVWALAAGVLALLHAERDTNGREHAISADRRISGRVAVILGAVSVAALLMVSMLFQRELERSFMETMHASLQARGQLYEVYLRSHSAAVATPATDPALAAALRALAPPGFAPDPGAPTSAPAMTGLLERFLVQGFSGLRVESQDGRTVAAVGRFAPPPEFDAPLKTPERAVLYWVGGEAILRSQHPIQDARGALGVLVAERPLPVLRRMLRNAEGLGEGGVATVCARHARAIDCLPTREHPGVTRLPYHSVGGVFEPLVRATVGERGNALVRDSGGRLTLVAFAPVGELGLGMAVRYGTSEAYAPLTKQLAILVPLLVLLVALGVALTRFQITPLVRRLIRSEREATLANEALIARSEALHFAEKRLRAIADHVPALIGYVDHEERYRFVNEYYRALFGRPPGELIGKPVRDIVGDAAYFHAKPYIDEALRGKDVRFENRLGDRYFLLTYTPDVGDDGTVHGFYAMSIDITERKRVEQALAESEQRLRMITDNLPVLISYIDQDQRFTFGNRAYGAAYGVPTESIAGKAVKDVLGAEVYRQSVAYLEAALEGAHERFERVVFRDGRARHELVEYVPDVQGRDRPAGVYGLVQDITRFKTMAASLAANERKLRTITDNLPALISYIDANHRFQFNNRTYEEWVGRPLSEIQGRLLTEVYSAEVCRLIEPLLDRAFQGERVEYEFEVPGTAPKRHVKGVYVPELDGQRRVTGVYGLTYDVTAAKAVEARLAMLAQFDTLTGLPNRRQMNATLEEAIARHRGDGQRMAVMFVDIDYFKRINDSRGHEEGDAVLKEFGQRLKDAVRSNDTVARLGGDEFVVVLEGLHSEREGRLVADKILKALEAPFPLPSGALRVTASIGIASLSGVELTERELLRRADAALYKAKQAGRNCYRIAA